MPELYAGLEQIAAALGTPTQEETLAQVFPTLPHQTIDYGIMEMAKDIAVLPVDIGWTDIGSWATLLEVLEADKAGNVVRGPMEAVTLDTKNSLIYTSKRLVTTIGVEDLIIVDTEDLVSLPTGPGRRRAPDCRLAQAIGPQRLPRRFHPQGVTL